MSRLLILLLGILIGLGGFVFIIHSFNNLHVTAVFEELEPFKKNLNVYYKGFKLGHSVRVYPSKDFTNTHVDLILNAKNLKLPDNTIAKIRTKNKRDYIELVYPDAPSITYMKNHSIIVGKKGLDISSYISDQADSGGLDDIKDNLSDTVASAGETMDALTDLFKTANDILIDLRPALKESGNNLAVTTQNFAEFSSKLNRSAKPQKLDNTFDNIELTMINLERTTRNFEQASLNTANITRTADSRTVTLMNCLLQNASTVVCNVNVVVKNVNDIVNGLKTTLSKKFGAMRVAFGKPLTLE